MNTTDRLTYLEELREAASPGPWEPKKGRVVSNHPDAVEAMQAFDKKFNQRSTVFAKTEVDSVEHYGGALIGESMAEANAALAAEAPALAASCIAMAKALEKRACDHEQWFTSKGVKHVTHEVTCASDETCRSPCPRCAALDTLPEKAD